MFNDKSTTAPNSVGYVNFLDGHSGLGTAFFITPNLILTNLHVIDDYIKEFNEKFDSFKSFEKYFKDDTITINPKRLMRLRSLNQKIFDKFFNDKLGRGRYAFALEYLLGVSTTNNDYVFEPLAGFVRSNDSKVLDYALIRTDDPIEAYLKLNIGANQTTTYNMNASIIDYLAFYTAPKTYETAIIANDKQQITMLYDGILTQHGTSGSPVFYTDLGNWTVECLHSEEINPPMGQSVGFRIAAILNDIRNKNLSLYYEIIECQKESN